MFNIVPWHFFIDFIFQPLRLASTNKKCIVLQILFLVYEMTFFTSNKGSSQVQLYRILHAVFH